MYLIVDEVAGTDLDIGRRFKAWMFIMFSDWTMQVFTYQIVEVDIELLNL